MSKVRCRCLVRHALTPRERRKLESGLLIARMLGDSTGVLIAELALRPCPRVRKAA